MDGLYVGIATFFLFVIVVISVAFDIWQCCLGRPKWWRK